MLPLATMMVGQGEGPQPWSLRGCHLVSTFDTSSQSVNNNMIQISSSGHRMFIIDYNCKIFEYALSTNYLASSASLTDDSGNLDPNHSAESTYEGGIFSWAGTKFWTWGTGQKKFFEYSCTAYDVSTFSYSSSDSPVFSPLWRCATISQDGDYILLGRNDAWIYQYSLSTSNDVSTMSDDSLKFYVGQGANMGVQYNNDRTKFFAISNGNPDDLLEFRLDDADDVSTGVLIDHYDTTREGLTAPEDMCWSQNGEHCYITDNTNDFIFHYQMGSEYDVG